jgi:hypothetical protein
MDAGGASGTAKKKSCGSEERERGRAGRRCEERVG